MGNILHGLELKAAVPQGSILGSPLLLVYTNDLSDDLATNVNLFADDTSRFFIVYNMNASTINLNNNLNKIRNWAIQWKLILTPILINKLRKLYFQECFKR